MAANGYKHGTRVYCRDLSEWGTVVKNKMGGYVLVDFDSAGQVKVQLHQVESYAEYEERPGFLRDIRKPQKKGGGTSNKGQP